MLLLSSRRWLDIEVLTWTQACLLLNYQRLDDERVAS
jgi:hypothetical protein